jgi:hypothetical protein
MGTFERHGIDSTRMIARSAAEYPQHDRRLWMRPLAWKSTIACWLLTVAASAHAFDQSQPTTMRGQRHLFAAS